MDSTTPTSLPVLPTPAYTDLPASTLPSFVASPIAGSTLAGGSQCCEKSWMAYKPNTKTALYIGEGVLIAWLLFRR
jgi:hypothetical protein